MRKTLACSLLLATLLSAAGQKSKPEKPPDVEIEEFTAARQTGRILIDGALVVNREEPIRGIFMKIELLAPGNRLISQRGVTVTEELLEAGDEVPFHLACRDQPRTVKIRVDLKSAKKMPLTVGNPGPYPIEE